MPDHDDADDLIALTALSRELLAGGFSDKPVEYARLYRGCLSARFPAEQSKVGRWSLRRRHLPAVAAALGLTPVTDIPPPSRRRIAA
jgi:hypothetical protein